MGWAECGGRRPPRRRPSTPPTPFADDRCRPLRRRPQHHPQAHLHSQHARRHRAGAGQHSGEAQGRGGRRGRPRARPRRASIRSRPTRPHPLPLQPQLIYLNSIGLSVQPQGFSVQPGLLCACGGGRRRAAWRARCGRRPTISPLQISAPLGPTSSPRAPMSSPRCAGREGWRERPPAARAFTPTHLSPLPPSPGHHRRPRRLQLPAPGRGRQPHPQGAGSSVRAQRQKESARGGARAHLHPHSPIPSSSRPPTSPTPPRRRRWAASPWTCRTRTGRPRRPRSRPKGGAPKRGEEKERGGAFSDAHLTRAAGGYRAARGRETGRGSGLGAVWPCAWGGRSRGGGGGRQPTRGRGFPPPRRVGAGGRRVRGAHGESGPGASDEGDGADPTLSLSPLHRYARRPQLAL